MKYPDPELDAIGFVEIPLENSIGGMTDLSAAAKAPETKGYKAREAYQVPGIHIGRYL
jgi:hypothetical protein